MTNILEGLQTRSARFIISQHTLFRPTNLQLNKLIVIRQSFEWLLRYDVKNLQTIKIVMEKKIRILVKPYYNKSFNQIRIWSYREIQVRKSETVHFIFYNISDHFLMLLTSVKNRFPLTGSICSLDIQLSIYSIQYNQDILIIIIKKIYIFD